MLWTRQGRSLRRTALALSAIWWLAAANTSAAAPSKMVEYEAENQMTSGLVIGPNRTLGTLAAEASGRRAVLLRNPTESIDVRLKASANALTIRFSLPEGPDGTRTPSKALIEAGKTRLIVVLRSEYSFDNIAVPPRATSGKPVHHFWDEVRVRLGRSIPPGTKLSIRLAPAEAATPVAIDLIDAEQLPAPARAPAGSISVRQFGADPTGSRSSRQAFIGAITAAQAQHRILYVPEGEYRIDGHLLVSGVTIVGAGSWYSILSGHRLGFYSIRGGSSRVSLSGVAVESDVSTRRDTAPESAIGGTFNDSSFSGLYLHHAKAGIWLDGPAQGLTIADNEIADQAADGINLHRGISNARIERNHIRNTGDDGIASWSEDISNERLAIRNNRVASPGLANGIAIYGGRDIDVDGNEVDDVLVEGGGIHLGARFRSVPFGGRITIRNNRLVRAATFDPNWHFGVGAIWIYALERPVDAEILLADNSVVDAGCEAVQFIGPKRVDQVTVDGLLVSASSTSPFAVQTAGSLIAKRVIVDPPLGTLVVDVPSGFQLTAGAGNRGWSAQAVSHSPPPSCL